MSDKLNKSGVIVQGSGVLSKGTRVLYKKGSEYVNIPDLQEVPEIGGSAEQVEVTTLADGSKRYIKGIVDFGELSFKFLYDNATANSSYRIMRGLQDADAITEFKIELPDGTSFAFTASVSTTIDSAGVNAAMTFSAALTLNSAMSITNPSA